MYNDRHNNQVRNNQPYIETHIDPYPSLGCLAFALIFMIIIILGVISAAG